MVNDKEYSMLRSEIDDNIRKQDTTFTIIFTILGISSLFTEWVENVAYLILILFITVILQAKILEYRNVVYYVSTYLKVNEVRHGVQIQREKNISEFKQSGYGLPFKMNTINICNYIAVKSSMLFKHLGNLALATFIFIRLINMIMIGVQNQSPLDKVMNIIMTCVLYLLNVIYTIAICTDKSIIPIYTQRWEKILSKMYLNLNNHNQK